MKALPVISPREKLKFANSIQIAGVGGPWVGDMYLGTKGICKRVLKNSLNYISGEKKLYFVQHHEGYCTINYLDTITLDTYQLDVKPEMAFIDSIGGNELVYFEAFNNQDIKYGEIIRLDKIKYLPLPIDDIPPDNPVRYEINVPPIGVTKFVEDDKTAGCILYGFFFGVLLVMIISGAYFMIPLFTVLAILVFAFSKLIFKGSHYITRLAVIDDMLHVEYIEKGIQRKKAYKLHDVKVERGYVGRKDYKYSLVIYNWKKTVKYVEQLPHGAWTQDLIDKVTEELIVFTPVTGRRT